MKTVIAYISNHHGNTKKIVEKIAQENNIKLVDILKEKTFDFSEYENIGFASGIAFGKYYPQIIDFIEKELPTGKNVFFIHTAGSPNEKQADSVKAIAEKKGCKVLGCFCCKGFDTFGPFKFIGGINKSHPTEDEIIQAAEFYKKSVQNKKI